PDPAWEQKQLQTLDTAANTYYEQYDPQTTTVLQAVALLQPWYDTIQRQLADPLRLSVSPDLAEAIVLAVAEIARAYIAAGATEEAAMVIDWLVAIAPTSPALHSDRLMPPTVRQAITERLAFLDAHPSSASFLTVYEAGATATGCG